MPLSGLTEDSVSEDGPTGKSYLHARSNPAVIPKEARRLPQLQLSQLCLKHSLFDFLQ